MAKWVYMFTEGNATMRNLLGGKGANLAEMTNLGLPVPQGFTITTEACTQYYEDGIGALLALHGAGGLDGPTVEQEFFGQCSFTGVGVRDDRKRAPGFNFFAQ